MLNTTALRGGAATLYYPIWHYEAPELIVLKNNRGVEENRIRQLDYGIQLNKLMYERIIKRGNITLFSPNDVPGMYEAFYNDQEKFEELYTKAEADESIRKRVVPAMELFTQIMQERASTGRIYLMNVDHCNTHSPFDEKVAPIHMSNLCVSGDTKVLVKEGDIVKEVGIASIEKQYVTVYNGKEWTEAYCDKTSDNAQLFSVWLNIIDKDGFITKPVYIRATKEHKWYINGGIEVRTSDLKPDDVMDYVHVETDGKITILKAVVVDEPVYAGDEPTWCLNEPKEHKVVFNGVLTGNCIEVALPTKPLDNISDEKGEIALCILAAVNVTATTKEEMGDVCEMCVRALDALIDYQTYPVPAARISTINRRSLGVGIINYAHFLAKNGTYYTNTTKANEITHELMELFQYSLIKASVKLAQEYGPCGWFNETKYSKGILPIDTYKKDLDDICPNDLKCDWESLRQDVLKYGMRNSTLSACMPSETSSQVANATNGIEPPRGLVSIKQSKDGILKQVVPDIKTLGLNYETAWNMQDNVGYIHKVCIMQKFVDQAISANEYYMPSRYPGGKVPMTELIKMKLLGYKYGMKTWYYHNTNDGADDRADEINTGCESGACAI